MSSSGIISILIIIITGFVSYKGFNDHRFFERYRFDVDAILLKREYYRIITSGFLHVGWVHLVLNMFSLFAFSGFMELYLGPVRFLLLYFGSMAGGDLLALWIHRNNGSYNSVGASGAVCGLIFAAIALVPGMSVGFIIMLPGWLYGLLFVLYSIYGVRSGKDNIGHEAHLGGGITGLLIGLLMEPSALASNTVPIMIIAIPTLFFIIMIVRKPHFLLVDNFFYKTQSKDFYSIDHKYNAEKRTRQREIDRLLEKIHRKGMNSLSQAERDFLKQNSEKL